MNKHYIFHFDAGHGWLEVPISDLRELGILDQISEYSFMHKHMHVAYLEEDCDGTLFVETARARGWTVSWTEQDDGYNSPVRRHPRFTLESCR